jgi:hypothetical protein
MKKIIFTLLLFTSISARSQDNSLTVIANNNGAPSGLSYEELQNVFMGKQAKWGNGGKVLIAMMKLTTDAGKSTCSKLYKMTPDQVTKHWLTVSMKGTMDAPVFFNTTAELQSFVSANAGAIGIMSVAVSAPNTKTVLVDGKRTF